MTLSRPPAPRDGVAGGFCRAPAAAAPAPSAAPARLSPPWLWVTGLALVLLAFGGTLADTDLALHLGMGRVFSAQGVPDRDPFSWTAPGTPWTPHEWLWSVLVWKVWQQGNLPGLQALLLLAGAVITVLLGTAVPSPQRGVAWCAVVALALLAAAPLWVLRPHLVFILGLLLAGRAASRPLTPRLLAAAVAGFLLWANLHASVLIGLAAWALLRPWSRGTRRRELLLLLLLALTTLITPAGARLWAWPLTLLAENKPAFVAEWGPFRDVALTLPGLAFLLLTALAGSAAVRARGALPWRLLLLWAAFTLWTMQSRRMAAPAAVLAVALVSALVRGGQLRLPALPPRWRLPALILLLLAAAAAWPQALPVRQPFAQKRAQVAYALQQAQQRLPAGVQLFVPYEWGGMLIFESYPYFRTFVDGRTEVFSARLLEDYGRLLGGDQELLDAYGVEAVLLPAAVPLAAALVQDKGWSTEQLVGGAGDARGWRVLATRRNGR